MIKLNTCLEATFTKTFEKGDIKDKDEEISTFFFQTNNVVIDIATNLLDLYSEDITLVILMKMEDFQQNGSGWTLNEIISLTVNNNKQESFIGSSYMPLPNYILNKKAVLNIENMDNRCFMWCILAAL